MNYQGLGDWLAQIEQNFNAERTGASIFCRFREAASSSEFILSCSQDLRMTFKCELEYIKSCDTTSSSLFGSKLVRRDNSRKAHVEALTVNDRPCYSRLSPAKAN
jgi:hypothetical protein